MNIFELPVPLETIIKNANTQMMNKYEHFITDITTRNVCMSLSNKAKIKKLHKFYKPSVSFN